MVFCSAKKPPPPEPPQNTPPHTPHPPNWVGVLGFGVYFLHLGASERCPDTGRGSRANETASVLYIGGPGLSMFFLSGAQRHPPL